MTYILVVYFDISFVYWLVFVSFAPPKHQAGKQASDLYLVLVNYLFERMRWTWFTSFSFSIILFGFPFIFILYSIDELTSLAAAGNFGQYTFTRAGKSNSNRCIQFDISISIFRTTQCESCSKMVPSKVVTGIGWAHIENNNRPIIWKTFGKFVIIRLLLLFYYFFFHLWDGSFFILDSWLGLGRTISGNKTN